MSFKDDLRTAIQESPLTYREVARHDYDAYNAASKAYCKKHGVEYPSQLPSAVVHARPKFDDFKLDTPVVKDVIDDNDERGYSEFLEMLEASQEYGVDVSEFGTVYFVDSYGGEGQGDQYWYVFKLIYTDGAERFFKVDGYYASYSGGYYDEMYEVFPKQVLRTEWSN